MSPEAVTTPYTGFEDTFEYRWILSSSRNAIYTAIIAAVIENRNSYIEFFRRPATVITGEKLTDTIFNSKSKCVKLRKAARSLFPRKLSMYNLSNWMKVQFIPFPRSTSRASKLSQRSKDSSETERHVNTSKYGRLCREIDTRGCDGNQISWWYYKYKIIERWNVEAAMDE